MIGALIGLLLVVGWLLAFLCMFLIRQQLRTLKRVMEYVAETMDNAAREDLLDGYDSTQGMNWLHKSLRHQREMVVHAAWERWRDRKRQPDDDCPF